MEKIDKREPTGGRQLSLVNSEQDGSFWPASTPSSGWKKASNSKEPELRSTIATLGVRGWTESKPIRRHSLGAMV